MSWWRKRNGLASAPTGRMRSLRTSAQQGADRVSGAVATSAATRSRVNSLPSTDAASMTARSRGSRRSRRAASSAWIVGGTAMAVSSAGARPCRPRSGRRRRRAWRRPPRRTAGCPRPRRGCAPRRGRRAAPCRARWRSRSAASASASGSSRTDVAFGLLAPQAGRTSSSSGRAMTSSSSGASRAQSATCSSRSMNVGSAQWRSSTTSTSGRSARERLEHPAHRPERLLRRDRLARRASAARAARAIAGSSASAATCSNRPESRPAPRPVATR